MSEIAPIGTSRVGRVETTPGARALLRQGGGTQRASDEVQVSPMATYLNRLRDLPIREELVADVRDQIAQGTYETPEKIEAAVSELSQDL